jgi:hypothetical protein
MPTSDEIDKLIAQLSHYKRTVRDEAEAELRRLEPENISILLAKLQQKWKIHLRYRYRIRRCADALIWLAIFSAVVAAAFGLTKINEPLGNRLFVIAIFIGNTGFILEGMAKRLPHQLNVLYELLLVTYNVQIVEMILDMSFSDTAWVSEKALKALVQFARQPSVGKWAELTRKQRKAFYHLVEGFIESGSHEYSEFGYVGLKALEQVGDPDAIPFVERIIQSKIYRVRQAAQECLPYLQARCEEQAKRETLLRASESTGGKEELLRVPAQNSDSESEQLLRVSNEKRA